MVVDISIRSDHNRVTEHASVCTSGSSKRPDGPMVFNIIPRNVAIVFVRPSRGIEPPNLVILRVVNRIHLGDLIDIDIQIKRDEFENEIKPFIQKSRDRQPAQQLDYILQKNFFGIWRSWV